MSATTETLGKDRIPSRTDLYRLVAGAALLMVCVALTALLMRDFSVLRDDKDDRAEINQIRYGLLNAEVWVNTLYGIVAKRIDDLEINADNKDLKENISKFIDETIIVVDDIIRKRNSACSSLFGCMGGAVKQGLTDRLIDVRSLREHVPKFTETALKYLSQPGAKEEIKKLLKQKLVEVSGNTFSQVDMTRYNLVLHKHGCSHREVCQAKLSRNIDRLQDRIDAAAACIVITAVAMFLILLGRNHQPKPGHVWLLVLLCMVLLIGGVSSPMIEIEAKIAELSFTLFGGPVRFAEQVLYYQNKSIADVVTILLATGKFKMILVAVLVALFSIAFPVFKMIASLIHLHDIGGKRESRLVRFFALKSGKWSMADVMVMAIFMACVGFDGIIESQLAQLQGGTPHVAVLSTGGGSHFQAGFYLFLGFCVASLVVSGVVEGAATRRMAAT
jgi:hypothetical protein